MSLFFFAGFQIFLFSYASLIGNHTICQLKYSSSGLVMQATWVTISPARLKDVYKRQLPLSAAITDAGMFNGYLEGYGITEFSLTAMDFMYARLPLALIALLWAYFYGYKHAPEQPVIPIEVKAQKRSEKKPLKPFSEKMGVIIFLSLIHI